MSASATVAALGAGRMGRGIAHAFAWAGAEVLLIDAKPRPESEALRVGRDALDEMRSNLAALAALGALAEPQIAPILARVHFVPRAEAPAALARAAVIFEGVPEVLEAKRDALAFACAHASPQAVIASTTSTFLAGALAAFVTHPQRFINAHWLNPAYLIPLVELSAHQATAPETIERLRALLESIGKVPVTCGSAPGYIVPRLQSLIMNEAARMIEQGVASAEEIDRAVRFGLGFRFANMGVVEFIDFGGNDILYYASRYLAEALGDARYASPAIVDRYMREGRNGLREGQGFYDWRGVDAAAYRSETLSRMLAMLRHVGLYREPAP